MKALVMKFGGTSVGDAECMRQVGSLVRGRLAEAPVVVLSAMSTVTNSLFEAARAAESGELGPALDMIAAIAAKHRQTGRELVGADQHWETLSEQVGNLAAELELLLRGVAMLRELSPRSMDAIASFGERLSTTVFASYLCKQNIPTTLVDARTVVRTDSSFGAAQPDLAAIRALASEKIVPCVGTGRALITQGYIGATEDGLTTTLGRGGSDYSAALFGAALDAAEVQIWTDVEGVRTCNPRIVPESLPIPLLSFAEASELAAFGASVLHPATIQPAVEAGIPVSVRHAQKPDGHFTMITGSVNTGRPVTALASRGKTTVLTVTSTRMLNQSGFLARLFDVFGRHRISVDLIATAEVSVSMTIDSRLSLKAVLAELAAFAAVEVTTGCAIIAVVGERLKQTAGLGARIFAALSSINVYMISMGANEMNLSLVVREDQAEEALRRLHAALFER